MTYTPRADSQAVLDAAMHWVQSVPYRVTARWVFYRLLQDSVYSKKAGYKQLLGLLSKARKAFYGDWRPDTLADDSRAAVIRGDGFTTPAAWLTAVRRSLACNLDKWQGQPVYVEAWFEASAMSAQFDHHAHPYIPLLAFHGDVSIPAKWDAAQRLADRYVQLRCPIHIYYYGDNDPKGLIIPDSAWADIHQWAFQGVYQRTDTDLARKAHAEITFQRVGLNPGDETTYNLPENPERPGTYQWEALADDDAAELIGVAAQDLDPEAFDDVKDKGKRATAAFRDHVAKLTLPGGDDDEDDNDGDS